MARGGWNPGLLRRIIGESQPNESATSALRQFRQAGGHIANRTWYRLWGEVENERYLGGIEEGRDLRYKPTGADIMQMTTVRATGFIQRVNVFARNQKGDVIAKAVDVKTSEPKSRAWAIREAERIATGIEAGETANPDTVIQQVLGGVYMATYELQPE